MTYFKCEFKPELPTYSKFLLMHYTFENQATIFCNEALEMFIDRFGFTEKSARR